MYVIPNMDFKQIFWMQILQAKNWKNLKQLHLSTKRVSQDKCKITNNEIPYICSLDFASLQILSIGDNKIGQEGVRTLINKKWNQLMQLNLEYNNIENNGFKDIIMTKNMPHLKILSVAMNAITKNGIQCMISSDVVTKLKYLDLGYNNIGSFGVKILSKVNFLVLQEIFLWYCNISSEGQRHLAKTRWPKLQKLRIAYNFINIDGYTSLTNDELQNTNLIYIRRMEAINTFCLMATNCTLNTSAYFVIYNKKLGEYVGKVVRNKLKK